MAHDLRAGLMSAGTVCDNTVNGGSGEWNH